MSNFMDDCEHRKFIVDPECGEICHECGKFKCLIDCEAKLVDWNTGDKTDWPMPGDKKCTS